MSWPPRPAGPRCRNDPAGRTDRRQLQMIALQPWGLSYEQIAARTGNSRRTVERQLVRARAKLAEALASGG